MICDVGVTIHDVKIGLAMAEEVLQFAMNGKYLLKHFYVGLLALDIKKGFP